jgi:uncharacterized caspase-like protein
MLDSQWHYAVVVGIDQYPDLENGRRNLRCPLEDARRMEEWLSSPQGGNLAGRVITLTRTVPPDRPPPRPVFDEINAAIIRSAKDFVKRRQSEMPDDEAAQKAAWQRSRFYFYISGHGMDGEGDDAVLITANASFESMNHISTRNVVNKLKQDRVFGELVIFADCCRDFSSRPIWPLPWNLANLEGYKVPRFPKTFVAFASRTRTSAFEPPPESPIKASIFTQALLEGLGGGVPGNTVNADNLKKFLYQRVPKLAELTSSDPQYPEFSGDDDIEFGATSRSYQVTLKVRTGAGVDRLDALEAVEMTGGSERSRTSLARTGTRQFAGSLPTGYYAIVPPGADPRKRQPIHSLKVVAEDVSESIG